MNNNNSQFQQIFNQPQFQQARKMAQGKNLQQIEQTARNLCQEQGLNYEQVLSQFYNAMKGLM